MLCCHCTVSSYHIRSLVEHRSPPSKGFRSSYSGNSDVFEDFLWIFDMPVSSSLFFIIKESDGMVLRAGYKQLEVKLYFALVTQVVLRKLNCT